MYNTLKVVFMYFSNRIYYCKLEHMTTRTCSNDTQLTSYCKTSFSLTP